MLNQSKAALIILAVTGFARVAIFAVPVVGVYFGVNSEKTDTSMHNSDTGCNEYGVCVKDGKIDLSAYE